MKTLWSLILFFALVINVQAGTLDNHEYKVIFDPMISWQDAKDAVPDGWQLATSTSEGEDNFIHSIIQAETHIGQYWLGAKWTDSWKWNNSEKWEHTNWWKEGPEWDGYTDPTVQSYLNMEVVTGLWSYFDDTACNNYIAGYVIEQIAVTAAPVPEPATMLLLGLGLTGLASISRYKRKVRHEKIS